MEMEWIVQQMGLSDGSRLRYSVLMVVQSPILGEWEDMWSYLQQTSNPILVQCPSTIYFLKNIDGDE